MTSATGIEPGSGLPFVHRWIPPEPGRGDTLLLLHGTGGDENDLIPLGKSLAPGAGMLSPRGRILENGMPRFFRRLSEGVFDEADLRTQAAALAGFLTGAAGVYGFNPARVTAVGFSNGANIAAAMLMLHPGSLAGALLYRAMVPLRPPLAPQRGPVAVLLSEGRSDPIVPESEAEELAALLSAAGAKVSLQWRDAGHALIAEDVAAGRAWLAARGISRT